MNEEILKKIKILEKQLEELTNNVDDEMILQATKEEKEEYLKILVDIKTKIEILKSYN